MSSYKQLLHVVPKICAVQTQGTGSIIFLHKIEKNDTIFL